MTKLVNDLTCAFLGHSQIVETCFGYVHCARCDALLGDMLGGVYKPQVIMGHDCETCRSAYASLTWRDKLFVKNPLYESEGTRLHRVSRERGIGILDLIKEEEETKENPTL